MCILLDSCAYVFIFMYILLYNCIFLFIVYTSAYLWISDESDAACLKSSAVSSPLSVPGCPGVQTHCVRHPILVRFSVLSGVMECLCVLVSVLLCISCPLHPDQCPMPSRCVPLCPPLHSNAMHSILLPVDTYTNHFNCDPSFITSCQAHWYIEDPPVQSVCN